MTTTQSGSQKPSEKAQDGNEVARKVFAEARKPAPATATPTPKQEKPQAAASPTPGGGGTTTQKQKSEHAPGQAPGTKAPDTQGRGEGTAKAGHPSKEERASWDPQAILPIDPAKMPSASGNAKPAPARAGAAKPADKSAATPSPDATVAAFEAAAQALEAAAAAFRAAAKR